ncbi:unnamed protein product [Haemonchus placei]|uniref:DDE_3 domain-containing protein n=1 Tax=Haemonchus placei TaxID=6290 RepID=A0A0N4W6A4_HAEPC|nr:unnamed protein product [Haemonchus placei]
MKVSAHRPTIEKLLREGFWSCDIVKRPGVPSPTVRNFAAALRNGGQASEMPGRGRPRTVNTPRIRDVIRKRITRKDGVSMNWIASDLNIIRQTVQKIGKQDLKLNSYRLRLGQFLSEQSKQSRLMKCKKVLRELRARRISDVIWTDEKIYTVEHYPNRQNQRQLLSKPGNRSPKCCLVHSRLSFKIVMVWAGVTSESKTPLVFIDRNVKIKSEDHQKLVLMDTLLSWITEYFRNRSFVLQQDLVPSHASKSTKAVLDAHFPGYWGEDIWLSSPPNLHSMNFSVWGYMESKIAVRSYRTLDALKLALQKAWDDIDVGYLRRTVDLVIENLKACVRVKGSYFEHLLS